MAATSVTGVGPGDSNGEFKPDNNGGCCGKVDTTATTKTVVKRGCFVRAKCCAAVPVKKCSTVTIKGC